MLLVMELHSLVHSHPTVGDGNQTNTGTGADLSEGSLESAITQIQKIKDDRGILVGASAVSLHIPTDLWATADQVLGSPGSTNITAQTGGYPAPSSKYCWCISE